VCKNWLKIPIRLGKMSENRRGFFWLTLYMHELWIPLWIWVEAVEVGRPHVWNFLCCIFRTVRSGIQRTKGTHICWWVGGVDTVLFAGGWRLQVQAAWSRTLKSTKHLPKRLTAARKAGKPLWRNHTVLPCARPASGNWKRNQISATTWLTGWTPTY